MLQNRVCDCEFESSLKIPRFQDRKAGVCLGRTGRDNVLSITSDQNLLPYETIKTVPKAPESPRPSRPSKSHSFPHETPKSSSSAGDHGLT